MQATKGLKQLLHIAVLSAFQWSLATALRMCVSLWFLSLKRSCKSLVWMLLDCNKTKRFFWKWRKNAQGLKWIRETFEKDTPIAWSRNLIKGHKRTVCVIFRSCCPSIFHFPETGFQEDFLSPENDWFHEGTGWKPKTFSLHRRAKEINILE